MHVVLQLLVPLDASDTLILEHWKRATTVLKNLDTYEWDTAQKRKNFEKLAADPQALAAIQGAAARGDEVPLEMLGVLVLEGGAESIDALVPHLDPALVSADQRLDRINHLRRFASAKPAIQAIFAEISTALAARNATSPALALGPVIGLGEVQKLEVSVRISSTELNRNGVPRVQGDLTIASTSTQWFGAYVTALDDDALGRGRRTYFSNEGLVADELGLGTCQPEDFPAWLANAAKQLRMELELRVWGSNLRGKKRDRVLEWLQGVPSARIR